MGELKLPNDRIKNQQNSPEDIRYITYPAVNNPGYITLLIC